MLNTISKTNLCSPHSYIKCIFFFLFLSPLRLCRGLSIFTILFFFAFVSKAQSLSYTDLINIQKSNPEKVKEILSNKKGLKFIDSQIDGGLNYNNYYVSYDSITRWDKSDSVGWEMLLIYYKEGYNNLVMYSLTLEDKDKPDPFSAIEVEVKKHFRLDSSGNYRDQNKEIRIGVGSLMIFDYPDMEKQISKICSACKGIGYFSDNKIKGLYNICPKCNGSRKNKFITNLEKDKTKVQIMKIDINKGIKNGPYLEPIACSKKKNYIALINTKQKILTFITVVVRTDDNLSLYKINADGTKQHMTGISKNQPITYSADMGSLWMVAKGFNATCVALFYVKDRQKITAIIK